ncbi:hypothetical protein [Marinisporobacter balticus]|uniref:Uncharacterized protein n=1 Tax=Marinisporobacter balticus TaxID=2018667 RepID=A0A4R2KDD5_9FIRM|nr:hypothetical protein [Marinisporobacter balticus]TCO68276.1 hypothetical protein EV214_14613 [Marinisporobacter balticus]
MRFKKSIITTVLLLAVACSTIVFAATPSLYQTVKTRLFSIADTYLNRESALIESGQQNQLQLNQYVESIEDEMRQELDGYEQQQIEAAKQEIQEQINAVKAQIDQERQQIEIDIKENIKQKIRRDLEKELEKIERELNK